MALVDVSGLHVTAQGDGGAPSDIVRDIGFSIERGEVLALIGESGSGKTTIALALLGYARRGCRIAGGSVRIGAEEVTAMSPVELSQQRCRRLQSLAAPDGSSDRGRAHARADAARRGRGQGVWHLPGSGPARAGSH